MRAWVPKPDLILKSSFYLFILKYIKLNIYIIIGSKKENMYIPKIERSRRINTERREKLLAHKYFLIGMLF